MSERASRQGRPQAALTPSRYRALTIVRAAGYEGIRPSEFARRMWPDSPKWHSVYHVGHGATAGAAVVRSGGAYLGRLTKAGLVHARWDEGQRAWMYSLLSPGRDLLPEVCPCFLYDAEEPGDECACGHANDEHAVRGHDEAECTVGHAPDCLLDHSTGPCSTSAPAAPPAGGEDRG